MSETFKEVSKELPPLKEPVPNPNVYLVYPDIIDNDGYDRPTNPFSQH